MSDQRLRELERRASSEGTDEARAELLCERCRQGLLDPAWLVVAARLDDPAARIALDPTSPPRLSSDELVESINALDQEACVRVAVGLGEALEADWSEWVPDDRRPPAALEAARAWLAFPDAEHGRSAKVAAKDARAALRALGLGEVRAQQAAAAMIAAAACASSQDAGAARRALKRAWPEAGSLVLAAARAALVPWALDGGSGAHPPRSMGDPEVARAATRALAQDRLTVFWSALEDKDVKQQATELRRRLRNKVLERDRVKLAAYLGDPAAWLVVKPAESETPDLAPPPNGVEMADRITAHLERFARKLPKAERRRIMAIRARYDSDGETSEPGPTLPEWSRNLIGRLVLAVGQVALPLFEAGDEDPRPRLAFDAARDFYRRSGVSADEVRQLGQQAGFNARRALPFPVKAAARVLGWTGPMIVRAREKARRPKLRYSNQDLLSAALEAGLDPTDLWDLLRTTAIAWALGRDDLGTAAQEYSPQGSYAEGEAVDHAKFGVGRVVKVMGKKVQIQFAEGLKTLVHAGP